MAKPSVVEKVTRTAKWAEIMTRWHITFAGRPKSGKGRQTGRSVKWQLVSFLGLNGRESRGVVHLIAIRKDHRTDDGTVRRGDFFDIVLIQITRGGAGRPITEDATRMRAVHRRYQARASVFVHWRKGEDISWHKLAGPAAKTQWPELKAAKLAEIFR